MKKYLKYGIITLFIAFVIGHAAMLVQGLTYNQILNSALDVTNGRLRLKIEDYDSTANTSVYANEQIYNQVYDSTSKALTVSMTGDMTLEGEGSFDSLIVNDDSAATGDARMESDTYANMFFLDASEDEICFGCAAADRFFQIEYPTGYSIESTTVARRSLQTGYTMTAAGIAWVEEMEIETSNANLEVVGIEEWVMDDVTATSEDVAYQIKTMTAGAAASEKISVGSTVFKGNDPSADYDFSWETDNVDNALHVDAGNDLVKFGAPLTYAVTDISAADYTLASYGKAFGVSRTASGTCSITIPTAFVTDGRVIFVFDTGDAGSNNITIGTAGAETINGGATATISTQYDGKVIISDGTNWWAW